MQSCLSAFTLNKKKNQKYVKHTNYVSRSALHIELTRWLLPYHFNDCKGSADSALGRAEKQHFISVEVCADNEG